MLINTRMKFISLDLIGNEPGRFQNLEKASYMHT